VDPRAADAQAVLAALGGPLDVLDHAEVAAELVHVVDHSSQRATDAGDPDSGP
jgi:hypothetical protein